MMNALQLWHWWPRKHVGANPHHNWRKALGSILSLLRLSPALDLNAAVQIRIKTATI